MKTSIALSLLLSSAYAACPDSCSGHGACGSSDKCTCYPNWTGGNCGDRVCPYELSWGSGHLPAECSDRGTCDRKTGECECNDGFEGIGCSRLSCPEKGCSGHGVCSLISDIDSSYAGWDKDKIQQCQCDPGYFGPRCDERRCPRGDDVMTEVDSSNVDQVAMVQTITIENNAGNTALVGEFTLSYTDWRGEIWETWAMSAIDATDITIKQALEALPNHAIPSVTVDTAVRSNSDSKVVFTVTFSDAGTTGTQVLLAVNVAGCTIDGCQPYYAGVTDVKTSTSVVAEATPATKENFVCSGRGACNTDEGLCECYGGYWGQRCESQTIIL